jgi:putative nucleotidyltransferase with HDIG domain
MTDAMRFITALGQAIAAMALYQGDHPARSRAVDVAYHRLQTLLHVDAAPQFSFVDREVVYGGRTMRDLREWAPAGRLTKAGIQRMEFSAAASREDFEQFLDELAQRLAGAGTAEAPQTRLSAIRYGALGLRGIEQDTALGLPLPTATIHYSLSEEIAATQWIHQEVGGGHSIPLLEAEATVRSLAAAMHAEQRVVMPLLSLREYDEYTTTHSLNVSVLTMALAEAMGMGKRDVRAFGVAGLLHDLGKTRIPLEVLNKPGKLTDEERALMQSHTVEGARIILESDRELDLAAAVAYEHHIMIDGGGYPHRRHARRCHCASTLVHVCDVYDALRTHRPYRVAWETTAVLDYIERGAGTDFDPDIARTFVDLMRRLEGRIEHATLADLRAGVQADALAASP